MTSCDHMIPELGGYVLGALEPDEAAAVREHLERCPACAAELERVAGLPELLALAEGLEETPAPPAVIEERVLDAVAREQTRTRTIRPRRRRFGLRPRVLALGGVAAAALVAVVLALSLGGDEPAPRPATASSCKPSAAAAPPPAPRLSSFSGGTSLHLSANDLAGDPSIVYEVICEGGGSSESAGTFRADAAGHAYAVLSTALRRGEYDAIRVVRKQRGAAGGSRPATSSKPICPRLESTWRYHR